MGREKRDFKRPSFKREMNNLLVIATEGQCTEKEYFEGVVSIKNHSNSKIYVEVLDRLNTNSSPSSVLRMLDEFNREFLLRDGDELWMVIDRDKQSWEIAEISKVASLVSQKKYNLAMSNPAFELWLLLHVKDIGEYSKDEIEKLYENKKNGTTRTKLEKELITICGSYNKKSPNLKHYLPHLKIAITRSEKIVRNPDERWPNYFGTHVHKVVKKILEI